MKRFITFITVLVLALLTMAQAPQKMNFQALVRDASNELVKNKQVTVMVSVTNASNVAVYSETQTVTTNGNGVAIMVIGEGTPTKGTFSAIDWANGSYFLQTSIDLGGGASALSSISPLLSVPYALYAEKANVDMSGYYSKTEIDAMLAELESKIGNGGGGGSSQQGNVAVENGAIKAAFSISDTRQIYFSQGNLQFQASSKTWRFAEHQFDIVGSDNSNISSTYSGWIDLFGWGTSGYNGRNPYMTSTRSSDYYGDDGYNDIAGTNYDWGVYNAVSNGGNQAGLWRTLTFEEWYYLINIRANAANKKGVASVNGVNGLILLPDDWTLPDGIVFTPGVANNDSDEYSTVNNYNMSDWSKMESSGAVFLPAAGYRSGTEVVGSGNFGEYRPSTKSDKSSTRLLIFYSYRIEVSFEKSSGLYTGRSIRLVQDVK